MLLNLLFQTPQMFLVIILAIVYALTIHEFAHAAAATYLGDNTAKYSGRLTFNPLAHLEFFGTLMLLLAGFGWGRPVPVNVYNLKWRRFGELAVSLAGPLSNFISVFFFIIIFRFLDPILPYDNLLFVFLAQLILINLILGIFNLIPIPPLDGSKVLFALLPDHLSDFKRRLSINGPWILLILLIMDNLLGFNIFGHIFDFFIRFINLFL
ncbi:MAG: site-2 protease family protein [Candidatus Komeilibacteria bacterium CG11_big_fil_rev_8_21_14_0_20_36_20]|uniref:Site-2 protease family protein n=1 Tax=Candidatus Komeilibacteria bacterium CG11_big_fil_rev_8_21_14_0_20_36_20 TaxID=1974477 RepID=A0A2H0NDU9_9BACT|nr:MAG: site-2 protease family protein [Candidatus Komeilibacteria bacterium CG11_big_fil_rev_8_21_14_0_20_36_20]PIR81414.1 MAG: site-2 protease family protein [Candidatus Komeilibacteria bacterium CG10_big_fil_rev_8_21_14_0_10_36_65]PJC55140.1 MAG: site-2 protease family protein [Candidatus Komeilibacteria bacterium CG_4_9_14_0_2_um_filter_36_13]